MQLGSGARVASTTRAFSQGAIQQTGNPLDLAIEGAGFIAVTRGDGSTAYSRSGSLSLDATGQVVTRDGLPVQPRLSVPSNATNVVVSPDGKVTAEVPGETAPVDVGQLTLTTFPNLTVSSQRDTTCTSRRRRAARLPSARPEPRDAAR
ncbi:MAG: flagellar hook-basal body complex protein [Polyangiaceae bacterium]